MIEETYMRNGVGFGSYDIDLPTLQQRNFGSYTVPGFCALIMALQMEDKNQRHVIRLLNQENISEKMLALGTWNLPHKNLQHIIPFHEAKLPRVHTQKAANGILLATSIAPQKIAAQQEAITTWTKQGFHVIAVNSADEIAQLQTFFPHVRFIEAQQDSTAAIEKKRIYIDEILQILRQEGATYKAVGIINADVSLYQINSEHILQACSKGMLFSHRIDIPTRLVYTNGFDAFFFTLDMIENWLPLGDYFLGEAWWDYIFPLRILRQKQYHNKDLIQASPPLCYHQEHETQWDKHTWLHKGFQFLAYLRTSLLLLKPAGLNVRPLQLSTIENKEDMFYITELYLYWLRHMSSYNVFEMSHFR